MSDVIINFKVDGADDGAKSINDMAQTTDELNAAISKNNKQIKTYAQQIKELRKEMIALGPRTAENAKQYDSLAASVDALVAEQDNLIANTGKLENTLKNLGGPLAGIGRGMQIYGDTIKNARAAMIQLTNTFPILRNAIAATGIGALVVVLGLLIAAGMKAFKTFEPLQLAVKNLGSSFSLLGKFITPLVDLVGNVLTGAFNGFAKAIAFVTGNMEEYRKEQERNARSMSVDKQIKEIERMTAVIETAMKSNSELLTQQEKAINQLTTEYLKTRSEILKNELLTEQERNTAITKLEENYRLAKDRTIREIREQQNQKRKLTDEEIRQLKELQNLIQRQVSERLKLLTVNKMEGEQNAKILEDYRKRVEDLNALFNTTISPIQKVQSEFNRLFGEVLQDKGKPVLDDFVADIDILFNRLRDIASTPGVLHVFNREIDKLTEKVSENPIFNEESQKAIVGYSENFKGLFKLVNQFGIEVFNLTNEQILLDQQLKNTNLTVEEQNTIINKKISLDKEALHIIKERLKANKMLTDDEALNNKIIEEYIVKFKEYNVAIFDFQKGIQSVNEDVNKLVNELAKLRGEKALLETFITQNMDVLVNGFIQTYGTFVSTTKDMNKTMVDEAGEFLDFLEKIKAIYPQLANVGQEYVMAIKKAWEQRGKETEAIIKEMNMRVNSSNLDRMLYELNKQKEMDMQLLIQRKATNEQLLELDKNYQKMKNRIIAQGAADMVDISAQSIGLIGDLMNSESKSFRTMKFIEAQLMAITSAIRAYEIGLTYGGPAGPILGPTLAAATFAAQTKKAAEILKVPEPQRPQATSRIGDNPSYFGYYEDGGWVRGPRHSQGGVFANMEGGEYVINRRSMNIPGVADMASALNNLTQLKTTTPEEKPTIIKTYVVSSDMTEQQRKDKMIKKLSRF